ncbi:hypothetical protein QVD17_15969 [Tagetes erecta]|uniref:Uncharacterized protein n=1 Tax=Tagetes erecta TaxID=13708 RepID=A0AAD8KU51_TARER|nr:hypothetical protein QVD17_15969 [Tagetes erecta]
MVTNSWRRQKVSGTPDFILAKKLKLLKEEIRSWCKNKKEEERKEQIRLQLKVQEIDDKADHGTLTETEKLSRSEARKEIYDLEIKRKYDLKQKARIRWDVDGDENTSYFHGIINGNKKRNRINGLTINGEWNTDPRAVKNEIHDFFKFKFSDPMTNRPAFENSNIRRHGIEKKDHSLGHVLYNLDDMEDPKRMDFHEESKDSRQTPRRCEATIIQLDQLHELKTNGKLGELVQIAL